jgi:flagellar biosynthesis/type III secretory pathway chaperone
VAVLAYSLPPPQEESAVSSPPSFQEELEVINRELRKSFLKLQSLLEKKRRALKEAQILEDRREQEHLEKVIREIEKKIREIRDIGLPTSTADR